MGPNRGGLNTYTWGGWKVVMAGKFSERLRKSDEDQRLNIVNSMERTEHAGYYFAGGRGSCLRKYHSNLLICDSSSGFF